MRLLRLPEVSKKVGLKRSALYRLIQKGLFPQPVKIFGKTSVWPEYEVDEVISALVAGLPEKEIQDLVQSLHENRKFPLKQAS